MTYASFRPYFLAVPNSLRQWVVCDNTLWSQFLVYCTFSGQGGDLVLKPSYWLLKSQIFILLRNCFLYSKDTSIYTILLSDPIERTLYVNCSVHSQTLRPQGVVWIHVETLFFDCNQENVFLSLIKLWNARTLAQCLTNLPHRELTWKVFQRVFSTL